MKVSAHSLTKTILEMDLVAYSDVARMLEENLNVAAVKEFQDQIQHFVDHGLTAVGLRRHDVVMATAGDNAILMFNDAATMHKFAQTVQENTLNYNNTRSIDLAKRWFRMGAATGSVLVIPTEHRIVGSTIVRAVRLEAAAEIGQLVVDLPTFDALPDELSNVYGSVDVIKGKRNERFEGRRCTLINVPRGGATSTRPFHDRSAMKFLSKPPYAGGLQDRPATAVLPFTNIGEMTEEANLGAQLSDSRDSTGRIIQTASGHGYRSVASVKQSTADQDSAALEILRGDHRLTASQQKTDFDDRPAIAVMPFANPRGDSDQQYFADGITDDIITELASCRTFPVIARGSTFAFRNHSLDIQNLSQQLGARYVLEGSVNKMGQQVRIRAQLIDAITGHYLLTERYQRDLGELFDIQDEIVETIVGSIAPEVLKVECERVGRQRQLDPTSYNYFIRGLEFHYRYSKEENAAAQHLFRQAIEADLKNVQACAVLALAMVHAVQQGWREDSEHNYEAAYQIAARAVALDPRAPFAHFAFGSTSMFLGRTERALAEMREAVRINPSHAAAYAIMAHLLCYVGQPGEGLESANRALRLSPYDPRRGLWIPALSQAYYLLKQYEDAITTARQALSLIPTNPVPARFLAASLGQLGRIAEAVPVLALLRTSKEPTLAHVKDIIETVYRVPKMTAHLLGGLKKAGLT